MYTNIYSYIAYSLGVTQRTVYLIWGGCYICIVLGNIEFEVYPNLITYGLQQCILTYIHMLHITSG